MCFDEGKNQTFNCNVSWVIIIIIIIIVIVIITITTITLTIIVAVIFNERDYISIQCQDFFVLF